MLKSNLCKFWKNLRKRPQILVLTVSCLVVLTLYLVTGLEHEFDNFHFHKSYNSSDDVVDGYLVWSPKCYILSKDPLDPVIKKYVIKQKFEACGTEPLMSHVTRDSTNGSMALVVREQLRKNQKSASCCWTPISRTTPSQPPTGDWDTKISVGKCENFAKRVTLPDSLEIVMITCRRGKTTTYKNIHAVINPAKVQDRLTQFEGRNDNGTSNDTDASKGNEGRKLSVLFLGIDSVSRLNFKRSMPKTERHLVDTGWFHLRGYNKMGDNTFPNLMAILTGFNSPQAYTKCKPTLAYSLDNCPMLWYGFRNAGYVTAYGEDMADLSTFNYRKAGFVAPPTDYYLRPYVVATEKLLTSKKHFRSSKYCTGPELSVERMFNYALEFARTFAGSPYFGFFWTNTASHEDANGISSLDERLLKMFNRMDSEGITNDTMIVFLSDHGMRWGDIRQTIVGWYEERLPFIYMRLPDWFRDREPAAVEAVHLNQHRLTSPYDLYETLRDILKRADGEAESSLGCPTCQSLFRPVLRERECSEAGISSHWCACSAFRSVSTTDKIALEGAQKFLEHVENLIKPYREKSGKRLCSKLILKKVHRVDRMIDPSGSKDTDNATGQSYFYLLEVMPGGALYEVTIRYHGGDSFTVNENEVSRINSYATSSECLRVGPKRYCHCAGTGSDAG